MKTILLALGRFGDVCSILPLAYRQNQIGNRLTICIAKEFESILDGISYADKVVWSGDYGSPKLAIEWLKSRFPVAKIVNAQAYRHPVDQRRLTDSYQKESWRLAGYLGEFGMWPTVFDRRDSGREEALYQYVTGGDTRPMILVGLHSVSSPFADRVEVMQAILAEFGTTHNVVNLAHAKADRIYDLLGLFDRAACLVTVDTVFLHLARASKVPVVALISEGNVGTPTKWFGSVPPPNAIYSVRYSEAKSVSLCFQINAAIAGPAAGKVVHVVDNHGEEPRHHNARHSWNVEKTMCPDMIPIYKTDWGRSIGGKPLLRDLLSEALGCPLQPHDVIIWSCSDTIFTKGSFARIKAHTQKWGACSLRRVETDWWEDNHMGRDAFSFTMGWLFEYQLDIPEFICGSPAFDLVLAALIRKQRGIASNKENLHHDIFPCEMPTGLILHEPHESSWAGANEHVLPANEHNRKLAREWCAREMPSLKL